MPVSRRDEPAPEQIDEENDKTPERLRPYTFHGVDLTIKGEQANGDCPFCGEDGKFTVRIDTGLWRCWVCGGGDTSNGGGNSLTFIRLLHQVAVDTCPEGFGSLVAADRRACAADTPLSWGVRPSPILPASWLIPGAAPDGSLHQLYRRVMTDKGYRLLPTPGVWPDGKVHGLHIPTTDFDPARPRIDIFEGPWDAMVFWELKEWVKGYSDSNIVAVPGCNVWRDEWTTMCKGKHVTLWYDNDHPRVQGKMTFRAGYDGMARVAKRLSGHAASVRFLQWGEGGYNPGLPSGWDVRDAIAGTNGKPRQKVDRLPHLSSLVSQLRDAPVEWFSTTATHEGGRRNGAVESQRCHTWNELLGAWQDAMRWRSEMSDALAVLLAVCASTQQAGNQLFLQLVGSAGSGKTTLCEGLLVSDHCHQLEHLTGFHSGWKSEANADGTTKDCSLIARINNKTLVTPEADVMISSPRFMELMSQQRRIFDGKSAATYKNSDQDTLYSGLRTPWIMAGTPALMDTDQSRLGDRFLRVIINDPSEEEKRAIMRSAIRSELMAMVDTSNGTAGSILDPKMRRAHALTGGYVDYLRANVESELAIINAGISDEVIDRCRDMAELSADLRARPNEDKRKVEVHDTKEMPTRLARQNIRLAAHLAVVLNKRTVDEEVLRIVLKVALDTAHGHSLNIVRWLCSPNPRDADRALHQECGGIGPETLAAWCCMSKDRMERYLMFLRKIDVLLLNPKPQTNGLWMLTDRVYNLYMRITNQGTSTDYEEYEE